MPQKDTVLMFRELIIDRLRELERYNSQTLTELAENAVAKKQREVQSAALAMFGRIKYRQHAIARKARAVAIIERCMWNQGISDLREPTGLGEAIGYALNK